MLDLQYFNNEVHIAENIVLGCFTQLLFNFIGVPLVEIVVEK